MTENETGNIITYLRRRHALRTTIYYLTAIPLLIYMMNAPQFNNVGPCNPPMSLLVFVVAIFITFILFFIHTGLLISKGRKYLAPFLIHLTAVLIVVGFIGYAMLAGVC